MALTPTPEARINVEFTEEAVQAYLDNHIIYCRAEISGATGESRNTYITHMRGSMRALQTIRKAIFGAVLPVRVHVGGKASGPVPRML